jgi:intein/homing endonuclease
MEFDNGSKIHAIPTSPDAGRGEAVSLLIVDEAAWIADFEDLWIGLQPTLSCLTENMLVFTDDGIKRIGDLIPTNAIEGKITKLPQPINLFSKEGYESATKYFVSPPSTILRLTTKRGYSVEVTEKHPLWRLTKNVGEMTVSSKLKVGDFLRVDYGQKSFSKKSEIINPDVAYALGGYVAEGNCIRVKSDGSQADGVQIRNSDSEFQKVFLEESLFCDKCFHQKNNEENRLLLYSVEATKTLRKMGINLSAHAHEKTTPKSIWSSSSEIQSHYLGGLFDGDGSVSNKEAILSSTSKKLIEETQILLLNKGIVSRIQFVDNEKVMERERRTKRLLPQGKPIQSVKPAWNLVVTRSQIQKFKEEVFLRIQRKKRAIEKTTTEHNQSDEKLFSVPTTFVLDKVNQIMERFEQSKEWFRRNHGLRFDKSFSRKNKNERVVTQQWLCKFRDILKKEGFGFLESDLRFFDNLCGSFFFDEIVKIEKIEEQKTYDFTVPKSHTFSQNGILGSNTGGDVILISSPSGVGTRFHKIWVGAQDKSNDFFAIELPWHIHPEHDEKWFDDQTRAIGSQRGINSELLCKFEGS